MNDVVMISTHDLGRAGALRGAFTAAGYGTELVTPGERLSAEIDAVLLILTGVDGEGGARSLAEQARELFGVSAFAVSGDSEASGSLRGLLDEVFTPTTPTDDIVLLGRRAVQRRRLQRITGIVGETDAIREALERVVQIAPVDSTVLVTGESGTGKELVARGIHALSPRRHKPFIAVNVAALSETLLESELFGHEKGAFTGAIDARRGLFELAHSGSIFLDEIGEMPLATQTKLLRVLEQREFHRVGGEKPIKVDVRIVAATNQDLRRLVATGDFRRDLYFRLNVLHIELPPLRDRREDIPRLVGTFVQEAVRRHDIRFPGITGEAMDVLREYSWPGNVRELKNLVESMVVLAPGRVIAPEDIPREVREPRGSSLLPAPIPRDRSGRSGDRDVRPELEFIFRTLVDLRMDMDELRREFEVYRRDTSMVDGVSVLRRIPDSGGGFGAVEIGTLGPGSEPGFPEAEDSSVRTEAVTVEDAVVFRAGMSMEDMEREAIQLALKEVAGNRRKAAELLGIGERTLYRKIGKYGLEE
ncbi:MAG: sigma-54 dependent transcriptional regulator [Gemmatimonadota bacterium]|nr:sigma-54 dependent transcriptional regulator [Gemmatimonadota bacterium]